VYVCETISQVELLSRQLPPRLALSHACRVGWSADLTLAMGPAFVGIAIAAAPILHAAALVFEGPRTPASADAPRITAQGFLGVFCNQVRLCE
jgi:hypothetical protein